MIGPAAWCPHCFEGRQVWRLPPCTEPAFSVRLVGAAGRCGSTDTRSPCYQSSNRMGRCTVNLCGTVPFAPRCDERDLCLVKEQQSEWPAFAGGIVGRCGGESCDRPRRLSFPTGMARILGLHNLSRHSDWGCDGWERMSDGTETMLSSTERLSWKRCNQSCRSNAYMPTWAFPDMEWRHFETRHICYEAYNNPVRRWLGKPQGLSLMLMILSLGGANCSLFAVPAELSRNKYAVSVTFTAADPARSL